MTGRVRERTILRKKQKRLKIKQMSNPPRRLQVQVWFWSIIPLFSSPYTPIHIITILHLILPSTLHCHHYYHHRVGWDFGADALLFSLATAAALSAEKKKLTTNKQEISFGSSHQHQTTTKSTTSKQEISFESQTTMSTTSTHEISFESPTTTPPHI